MADADTDGGNDVKLTLLQTPHPFAHYAKTLNTQHNTYLTAHTYTHTSLLWTCGKTRLVRQGCWRCGSSGSMGTRGRGRVGRDGTWLTHCGRQQQHDDVVLVHVIFDFNLSLSLII